MHKKIVPPERLCLINPSLREESLNFIRSVTDSLHKEKKSILIDLSNVNFASAAISVLLFAVVSRAQLILSSSIEIRFNFPKKDKNEEGHRCIVGTGLSKALASDTSEKLDNLVSERRNFQSSVKPEKSLELTLDMLQKKANLDQEQLSMLMMAMNEALLNVTNHAYDDIQLVELMGGNRWWQCAWFDPKKDKVIFIICDLGITIPVSYTGRVGSTLKSDLAVITEAMTLGFSRIKNEGRGNGSEDIKRPITLSTITHEKLMVFSGRCLYEFDSLQAPNQPIVKELIPSIPGTILMWTLTPKRG